MGNFEKHVNNIERKIKKFEKQGKPTAKLKRELAYCMGEIPRPPFRTGAAAHDKKFKMPATEKTQKKKDD